MDRKLLEILEIHLWGPGWPGSEFRLHSSILLMCFLRRHRRWFRCLGLQHPVADLGLNSGSFSQCDWLQLQQAFGEYTNRRKLSLFLSFSLSLPIYFSISAFKKKKLMENAQCHFSLFKAFAHSSAKLWSFSFHFIFI